MAKENTKEFQLVIIGGGPGGYAAAFHAAELGMQVALIDKDPTLGGVCLNRGCIPSKALLHVAKLIHEAEEADNWGIKFNKPKITVKKLREWKGSVVSRLTGGLAELAKRRKVEVIRAKAFFDDSRTVKLEYEEGIEGPEYIQYEHAILATGSVPTMPGLFKLDDDRVMDSTGALELEKVPKSLLVIGGGYIGLEMGTVYHALGSKVTVVELTGGLLPGCDRDLVRPLQKSLESKFEKIFKVVRLQKTWKTKG